jgi:RNA polymerase sigma-70 factor (ECF subfamily)
MDPREPASAGDGATPPSSAEFEAMVAPYRRELRAYCYRMAGAMGDADDLLQEGLLRAWRGLAGFEARASLRTWLYRVVANTCINELERRQRRVLPPELGPAARPQDVMPPRGEPIWIEPAPEALEDLPSTPESQLDARESIALAFLTAIQVLPPRQRAVLLLRDVLGWSAAQCAELLSMSVAAVNSALQRARETVAARRSALAGIDRAPAPDDVRTRDLLARYVRAWEDTDVGAFAALLREDAVLTMPPMSEWLQGRDDIAAAVGGMAFHAGARGNLRLVPTRANGQPAFAGYERGDDGVYTVRAIHVLQLDGDRVAAVVAFVDPQMALRFGAAPTL